MGVLTGACLSTSCPACWGVLQSEVKEEGRHGPEHEDLSENHSDHDNDLDDEGRLPSICGFQ